MIMNLKGKVAIVSGGARDIGRAISVKLAAEGARVVCAARTLNEGDHMLEGSLARTVEGIKQAGGFALNFLGKGQQGTAFAFFKPTEVADGKISGDTTTLEDFNVIASLQKED